MLPGLKTYATAIRFNPFLFELPAKKENSAPAILDLPYRLVFAVATADQVIVYGTDSTVPLAVVGNIHYAPINDLSWVGTNRALVACSSDGYCSIMTFGATLETNVLGKPLVGEEIEDETLR